jgi:hypothetical protein
MQNLIKRKIILDKILNSNKKNNISKINIIKFIKYNFSDLKINKTAINKRLIIVNEELKLKNFYSKIYKRFIKFSVFSIFLMLTIYIFNAKELFKILKLDKKILKKIRQKEEKNNIDLEYNEKKIREFDEKFGINKPLDVALEKINFGNKVFNEKKENETLNETKKDKENINQNNLNIIDLTFNEIKEKENNNTNTNSNSNPNLNRKLNLSKIQLNVNNEKRNVMTIKGEDFEQISFSEGKFDNPDPRILGTTVVFDTRLNEKLKK